MGSLRNDLFPADRWSATTRKRRGSRLASRANSRRRLVHEHLEARRLLAIDVFQQAANGQLAAGWVTIIANNGDDAYVQRAATKDGALLVANNASFLNPVAIPNIDTYADVFVTNATKVDVLDQETDGYPLLPFPAVGAASNHTYFVLPLAAVDIDTGNAVTGFVSNGVGGRWSFFITNTVLAGVVFNFVDALPGGQPSQGPVPVEAQLLGRGTDDFAETCCLDVTWSTTVGFSAESPPVLESMTFDRQSSAAAYAPETYVNMPASSAARSTFTLPVGAGNAFGEIVAGTLSGVMSIDQGNASSPVRFQFSTQTLNPAVAAVNGEVPLVFVRLDASGNKVGAYSTNGAFTSVNDLPRRISGSIKLQTGIISIETIAVIGGAASSVREVGAVQLESASFARFEQPTLASDFTLFPGQDFLPSLTVDLLAPGSTVSIESPIVDAPFVDVRGTNVVFDARVSSKTSLSVGESRYGVPVDLTTGPTVAFTIVNSARQAAAGGNVLRFTGLAQTLADELTVGTQILLTPTDGANSGSVTTRRVNSVSVVGADTFVTLNAPLDTSASQGLMYYVTDEAGLSHVPRTVSEQAFFNAAVAAKAYDLRVADDIQTTAATRSKLFVSATGSLAGGFPVAGASTPFDTLFALVNTGDILVEGTINGDRQSYIMQSPQEGVDGANHRGPYYFSTQSLVSGGNTGMLMGGTAAITLGNDVPSVYDDTVNGGGSAYNVVTLRTELDNLRVQAADRRLNPLQTPFPYDLDVSETDDLVVDAVAASSLPIAIRAGGDIDFRATLATASDVTVVAGDDFQLNAPLSSAFGSIALTGKSLTVANSCRVLDGFSDDLRTDITLTATAGSIKLAGAVSAVNTIELSQTDTGAAGGGGQIFGDARAIADTLSFRSTGSVSLGTDVRLLKGRAERNVSIVEANTVYADVTATGIVSLTANGTDAEMSSAEFAAHMDRNDSIDVQVTRVSADTFTLPANFAGLPSLYVGMGLQSDQVTVAAGATAASIRSISAANSSGVVTVQIDDGAVVGNVGDVFAVRFGTYAEFTVGNTVVPTPVGAVLAQLSEGQQVVSDFLPDGTRIVAIDATAGTLTLSAAATASGVAAIRFVEAVTLWGSVRDASSLVVSAPKGSIDIYSPTSATVVLGDRTKLAAGTAASMLAGGTVTIRSLGGSIDVLDAPVAGSGATAVRVAATVNVGNSAVYDARTPGTFPGTLTNGDIGALVVDGVTLVPRDRVLLTAQVNPLQNGVYQVIDTGSASTRWKLARLAEFDTTAEMPVQARFTPIVGSANAGKIFAVSRYANVAGTTPVAVEAVPNRYGALPVAAVSTVRLTGVTYDNLNGVIESDQPNAIPTVGFDGVQLQLGDLVLVRLGVFDASIPNSNANMAANGVYKVDNLGSGVSNWKLTRVGVDVFDMSSGGYVVVNNGTLRSRVTGNAYRVAYDALGVVGMTVADVTSRITTDIGSDNFNSRVTYVVSTNGGTNAAAGALGKMLLLAQKNLAVDPSDPTLPQGTNFRFGNTVSQIVLTQQLPQITRPLSLDGLATRYAVGAGSGTAIGIDGSRITTLRDGRIPAATDQINGIEINGRSAAGTSLKSFTMYGFTRGAAVSLAGNGQQLDGVLVDRMKLGSDLNGRRVANRVGIQVTGAVGGNSTISRTEVLSSTVAGIQITNGSGTDGVRLVGNTIGRAGFENAVGIDVNAGATRVNRIGLEAPGGSVSRVTATRTSATVLTLPTTFASWSSLYVGMGVSSSSISLGSATAAAATIQSFDQVSRTVTIAGGTILSGRSSVVVDFGTFAAFTSGQKVIALPQGLTSIESLYLGQPVASASLPANTVIAAIDRVANTITLSNAALRTAAVAVTFTAAGRNSVASNIRGVVLTNGATQVVASDVLNSVFDGIRVNGGTPRIGAVGTIGSGGRSTAKDITANSNTIAGNGGAGISIASGVAAANVTIQGNRLGVDASGRIQQPNRQGNILFAGLAAAAQPSITGTFTRSGTTVTVTVAGGHGLPSDYKVYVAGSSGLVGGAAPAGAYKITRVSATVFTFTVPAAFTATSGSLRFEKYGPSAVLSQTDNRDFEGNLHGLLTQPVSGGGGSGGGVLPPTAGRPVAPPPRQR